MSMKHLIPLAGKFSLLHQLFSDLPSKPSSLQRNIQETLPPCHFHQTHTATNSSSILWSLWERVLPLSPPLEGLRVLLNLDHQSPILCFTGLIFSGFFTYTQHSPPLHISSYFSKFLDDFCYT